MRGTLRLFTVRGIPIRLHWSFLFVPAMAYLAADPAEGGPAMGVTLYGLLFTLVVLHELAHSTVAQSFGIRTREIVLTPFGGVAALERIPENPREEGLIAIAGPAFNLATAALVFAFIYYLPNVEFQLDPYMPLVTTDELTSNPTWFTRSVVVLYKLNLTLAAFNLLPMFPMDGGRIFRAMLVGLGIRYERATTAAVAVSSVLILGLAALGVTAGAPFVTVLAVLLGFLAFSELAFVRQKSLLEHLTVDHLPRHAVAVEPDTQAAELLHVMAEHPGQVHFPVLDRGRLVGVACGPDIAAALRGPGGAAVRVASLMRPPLVVAPRDALATVARRLAETGMPAACVLDGGQVVGLVTREQLAALQAFLATGSAG